MVPAYNKVTKVWTSTEDGSELTPPEQWMIDPLFADEEFARAIGQRFWTFNDNTINTPTPEEHALIIKTEQQAEKWREIQAERDMRKSGGVAVGPYWFHSDDTSRIQFIGLVLYGANMPNNIMWKTMAGSFIQMTPTLALQVFGSIAAKDTAIFSVAEQHKALMLLSENPVDYNFKNGSPSWPLMFGE
jgi:hypothetical protein